ncbi:MAG TPA: hypothetical protein VE954_11175 [Oligoflexus sp.]|uniref:hypothetical protein n=1 Tax=Oligoflexus sp. TaxID=1971216 RepID=UPI002D2BC192|nr:hypothetical protein [Oligoflexus sp.]HYX33667.1 hypothetical protein [Oligoflexus sp.]
MSGLSKLTGLIASALLALLTATHAQAAISISLSGSSELSNAALERYRSNSISANVSLGLGQHFLIGLTHRRSFDNKVGLKKQENVEAKVYEYLPFEDNGISTTNSMDLTIIPYNGMISPMVFGGLARRDYFNEISFMGSRIVSRQTMFPIPNYGFGTIIHLGAGMQLKITQTYSPGIQTTLEDGQEISRIVKDSYTQIWLGYRI